ncbi:MAG TPA: VWA domain-containing protein [Pirellulales bacterium]|nr:VWA domain-containing protein [Pirellulales bacterium]
MPRIDAFADPKLRRFALWGAAGCLAGALIGQLLLAATRSNVLTGRQAVCLLIDCSGSMLRGGSGPEGGFGQKLHEVKVAAAGFASRHETAADRMAVIGFGQTVHRATALTDDTKQVQTAIQGLFDGGSTAMDLGLESAARELDALPEGWRDGGVTRSILLFTDGQPDNPPATLAAAAKCRQAGLRIAAIGTGDAATGFLAQVTGDEKLVFHVGSGDFDEGFREAEKAIYGGSLVEAGSSREGFWRSLLRTAGWGLLAACGMSLALVAGQNRYLHRPALTGKEAMAAAIGGAVAGLCGALAGQFLFSLAEATAALPVLGSLASVTMPLARIVGWSLMGLLAGWGLSWFVPNLLATRGALGGAIGGAVGGLAFLIASLAAGPIGALTGAAILGAAIGIMLAWVEAAFRQAWLEVHYGKELITVSLGSQPVKIGSDNRACQVYARGARPLACQYTFADGHVTYVDFATEKSQQVEIGHEQEIGGIRVIVRGSRDHREGAAGAPNSATRVTSPPAPKVARPSAPAPPDAIAPEAKAPARTITAPPPPPRKSTSPSAHPTEAPAPSTAAEPSPTAGTRVIRPVPPPPPPRKKE